MQQRSLWDCLLLVVLNQLLHVKQQWLYRGRGWRHRRRDLSLHSHPHAHKQALDTRVGVALLHLPTGLDYGRGERTVRMQGNREDGAVAGSAAMDLARQDAKC